MGGPPFEGQPDLELLVQFPACGSFKVSVTCSPCGYGDGDERRRIFIFDLGHVFDLLHNPEFVRNFDRTELARRTKKARFPEENLA
jgi:hypothetical protein